MKRLANLKNSSSASGANGFGKRSQQGPYGKSKKANVGKNNPYPISGKPYLEAPALSGTNGHLSIQTPPSGQSISYASPTHSKISLPLSSDGQNPPTIDTKSMAPTLSTNPETVSSDAAHSKAGTTATLGGAVSSSGVGGGEGSTFSSPAPSVRSMTTTLTTIQSTAPSTLLTAPNNQGQHVPPATAQANHNQQNASATHFTHQFPTTPVSAIPSYLTQNPGANHPTTYTAATANNLLTDNASVMTLASSSKRRRRNSVDTNASIRAMAPSSLYGGSKESLPLSVMSANVNDGSSITGHHQGRQVSVNLPNIERASVYSSSGIAPALPSERNSYYATKPSNQADGVSVRSGVLGHGRNDSITKSISGLAAAESPLSSPREATTHEKHSRRNSGITELTGDVTHIDDEDRSSLKK